YSLFFLLMTPRPPYSPLFPYTTLFRSLDEAQLDQGVAQAHPGVLLLQQSLFELIRGDQPIAEQKFAELVAGGCCGGRMQLVGIEPANIGIGGGVVKAEAVSAPKTSRKDATI